MPDIRITDMIAIPAPIERPHEIAAIWAVAAINTAAALVLFAVQVLA